MKAIIFAGGVGTRLWPLSRRRSPKQFEKVIGDKSTLQLAIERLLPAFNWEDLYIATSEIYTPLVSKQLPKMIPDNIIAEPQMRDVGPAVGLATAIIHKKFADVPVVILWSDHLIKKIELFKEILTTVEKIILKKKDNIIFIGQKPRFASQNLGWIKYGDKILREGDITFYKFENFYYRPSLDEAAKFLKSGQYSWNLGYFVTTASYLWKLYEKYQPEMFAGLTEIRNSVGTSKYKETLRKIYPKLPKISFDNAILEKMSSDCAMVISEDLGWSDVGTWEALKEALQRSPNQNVVQGKVLVTDCEDTLVYNYTNKLVVTIDLDGFLVVNTNDVILVCHKNSVPKIKRLVEKLAESKDGHLI